MKMKMLGAAASALLLSACAHAYPDLATFPAPEQADPSDEVAPVLIAATDLQSKYSLGYKETARWQDISQMPIIGAAAAAGWILLNDHKKAAKQAGKIGIGALSYTAARDQLIAKGIPDAYIAGHGALTCVIAEGSNFSGQSAANRHTMFQSGLAGLSSQIQRVSALRYVEPKKVGSYADMLKAARTLADQAIAAARTAETNAFTQEGAFQGASPVFKKAVSSISVRVASKGRVRPPVDFTNLRDQMAPPSGGERGPAPITGRNLNNAGQLIQELIEATNELSTRTAQLTAGTPNYVKSLERVQDDCVKIAPQ